jgi:Nif-specific regulatory protein
MLLVATTGPYAGTVFHLADGLVLETGTGSSRELPCRVTASSSGGFVVHATSRRVPVFVNGLSVRSHELQPHDELQIGDSSFVVRAAQATSVSPLTASPAQIATISPFSVRCEFRVDDVLLHVGDARARESRDLATLLRVTGALSSIQGLASLDAAVAGLVFDVVPAGGIAFVGVDRGQPAVRSAWRTGAVEAGPISLDPGVVQRVVTEGTGLVLDVAGRAIVATPMVAFGRGTELMWVEVSPGASVDDGHLRLLAVVAALAGVARAQAREAMRLQEANELLQAEINLDHNIVGRSRQMHAVFARISRVAKADSTILLRGESGTGKELVARAVHRNSARAARSFVAINCAALTESLLESELFGHERGAFTGAVGLKKGKLELADGGTLFLDEIGELPPTAQAKLLRALEQREFERVGGTRPVRVDFRLIAATNRDLEAAMNAGVFRPDLFYRLNVVALSLPPLRDRKEDLPVLVQHFIRKHGVRCGRRVQGIAPAALARLAQYDWPGNVRELENVVEQALVLGAADRIEPEDLPVGFGGSALPPASSLNYAEAVQRSKRELIVRAFERAGRSHARAAKLLGVHPNYLHRLIRNLRLQPHVRGDEARLPVHLTK